MPRPNTLISPGDESMSFLGEDGALQMVISYFEDWSARQSAMLKDTHKVIDTAKAALPASCFVKGPGTTFRHSLTLNAKKSSTESEPMQCSVTPLSPAKLSRKASIDEVFTSHTTRTTSRLALVEPAPTILPKRINSLVNHLTTTVDGLLERNPPPSGLLARAMRSRAFEIFFVGVILANVLILILSTDVDIQNALTGQKNYVDTFSALDQAFASLYAFELACRLYAYRLRFFLTIDWRWNLLDALLTVLAIEDVLVEALGTNSKNNLNFLRLIRLLKLLKTLRLFRILRAFRELRTMLNSIVGSIYVMAYALVLIVMVMFAFGIFISQGVALYLEESNGADAHAQELLVYYWGSVTVSMASSYMAVLGGVEWREMADSLQVVGEGFRLAFFLFVAFFLLVIVNTVTSVFVESAIQAGEKDSQVQIKEEMGKIQSYVAQFKDLFRRMDLNNDGVVDFEELLAALERPEMIALMSKLMIDIHDAKQFLQEVFAQGQDNINLDSFVTQCLKIRGPARSIDLISFAAAQQNANSAIVNELSTLRARNDMIEKILLGS